MRRGLRAIGAIGVMVSVALVAPVGVTDARADPIGNCTTSVGTIIAVDFSHWGGPLVRGCGVNAASGYALLRSAGFSTVGNNHDGPAFICRLGNQAFRGGTQYPPPAQDPCVRTPPAAAYWSYWLAPAGQNTWSYSPRGAIGQVPKPGAVELWIFGGTNTAGTTGSGVPTFTPDSVRAHNPGPIGVAGGGTTPATRRAVTPSTASVPAPTAGPTPAPGPTVIGSAANESPNTGSTNTGSGPTTVHDSPPSNIGARSPTTVNAGTPNAITAPTVGAGPNEDARAAPPIVSALPAVSEHESSGSMAPTFVGVGLLVVLAGATAGSMRRRRQRRE